MGLKIFTSACLVASFLFFLAFFATLSSRPSVSATREVKKTFAQTLVVLSALDLVAIVGAGVGALLIMRRAREEYRLEATANLHGLLVEAERAKAQRDE